LFSSSRSSIIIHAGEELVQEPFRRLIAEKQLVGFTYDGFWRSMDTFKEKQELDDLAMKGIAPWQLWKRQNNGQGNHFAEAPVRNLAKNEAFVLQQE